ncbi:MAG: AAA family ATPase [Nitrospirae bacterium]|uniref:Magnetosome protein Mad29 n=1 Tax=uncultured Nitrospirota bacterium TaxID=170969 RepID=A0A142BTT5_9BACT|nr:magnetosome protein Mad29 [uncultured Nitrospirota bacterium]MBF0328620.1 AAA family ATPase [Nitrospirota bacterium]
MSKKVIAIVGPKGGVGKSTISVNLAIALAGIGKKVIAVDLDLGGANLHILMGLRSFKHSLDDFILKKVKSLEEILIETGIENLSLICGGSNIPDIANMPFQQKMKLINHILKLDSDIVILDLAAGSSFNVVDFLMIANQRLMVTTPEMTSLLKAYTFIKTCVFRMLTFHFKTTDAQNVLEILEKAKDPVANPHLKTMQNILDEAAKINPASTAAARELIAGFKPNILINMTQSERDANVGNVIQGMLNQYLGIFSSVITTLPTDPMVKKATLQTKPVMLVAPESEFSIAVRSLALQCL